MKKQFDERTQANNDDDNDYPFLDKETKTLYKQIGSAFQWVSVLSAPMIAYVLNLENVEQPKGFFPELSTRMIIYMVWLALVLPNVVKMLFAYLIYFYKKMKNGTPILINANYNTNMHANRSTTSLYCCFLGEMIIFCMTFKLCKLFTIINLYISAFMGIQLLLSLIYFPIEKMMIKNARDDETE